MKGMKRIGKSAVLIHHAANRGGHIPPNSLQALNTCLESGARCVEVDIIPLADGDFALLHDHDLDTVTNGQGAVSALTSEQIISLRYTLQGEYTDEPVCTLSQALNCMRDATGEHLLQLDLKPYTPLTYSELENLAALIKPQKSQILVSSVADWAIRRLHNIDPEISLGFDPMLYLGLAIEDESFADKPPFRVGAYGFRDDHPLSSQVWGSVAEYLDARAEVLYSQVPENATWFIRAELLLRAMDERFDWVAFLHSQGCKVGAWMLNLERPGHEIMARNLLVAGVDYFTTDNPPHMAERLKELVEY